MKPKTGLDKFYENYFIKKYFYIKYYYTISATVTLPLRYDQLVA